YPLLAAQTRILNENIASNKHNYDDDQNILKKQRRGSPRSKANLAAQYFLVCVVILRSIESSPIINSNNKISLEKQFSSSVSDLSWPKCFLKSSFKNIFRSRRASISRAFWNTQGHFDDKRFSPFSPRLGKRTNRQEEKDDMVAAAIQQLHLSTNTNENDFSEDFYIILANWLNTYPNDVIYQDDKHLCIGQRTIENIIEQIVNQIFYYDANNGRNIRQGNNKRFLHPYENALIYRSRTG
ncbi:unnamed protein product, partial [Didymodactylos carnosus]